MLCSLVELRFSDRSVLLIGAMICGVPTFFPGARSDCSTQ
jgi:hypothetical protein